MKNLSILSVFFFAVLSGALGSPPSEGNDSNLSKYNDWSSYDTLPFADITQWKSGRKLQTEPDDTFAGEDMVVMVSFEDICKFHVT
jgi:hypothetical protein